MKAVFLAGAKADVEDLRRYIISRFGMQTWRSTHQSLKHAVRDTLIFPLRGKVPDELLETGMRNYRQVLTGMNRIIYEIRGEVLYIHIVCDARKDLRSLLVRRMLRQDG